MHFIDIRLEDKKPRERLARHLGGATGHLFHYPLLQFK